jgi:M-phase inducer tyrosine phosphatase
VSSPEEARVLTLYVQLNDVLDGAFKSQIASYRVIDCRFDYEYNGGHVPGAININTTMQLEEYFLGATAEKPAPSVSGEGGPKHILIFHCEFSAKRAPTL